MSKEFQPLKTLEALKNIEISHVEQEVDEDFNGDWVYDTVEVHDGTFGEKYAYAIAILEKALLSLKQVCDMNIDGALDDLSAIEKNLQAVDDVVYAACLEKFRKITQILSNLKKIKAKMDDKRNG